MTMKTSPQGAPAWLADAWKEIGVHEVGNNRGGDVRRYIGLAHAGAEGDPWCAIFANAMLESAGIKGTRSASSQSFRHDQNFVQLSGPALGAIAVFWRIKPASGLGHVGFYCGERGNYIWTLGGNESDMVQVEMLARSASNFGLRGYYWPKAVALPAVKPVIVDASVPAHTVSVA
jgi:uncharacterized protein (TIGR02594 family)